MVVLLLLYLGYLILYFLISYAILFHLIRFRVEGDKSMVVVVLYSVASITVIVGSIFFLKPIN